MLLSLLGLGACSETPERNIPSSFIPAAQEVHFGVSIAGAEFGSNNPLFCNDNPGILGQDYFYNQPWTFNWFAQEGVNLIRLPFRWERIQPQLNGPLYQPELDRLIGLLHWADKNDVRIILDMHNFGRYSLRHNGAVVAAVVGKKYAGEILVSTDNLIDAWAKIIHACEGARVTPWALGLMNEPHDMGFSKWRNISSKLVAGLRAEGSQHTLLVAGDGWSSAENWKKQNGPKPWIDDPLQKIVYEAHVYFDHDGAGKYGLSFGEELRRDEKIYERATERLMPFLDWLKHNNARGIIGEIGVPNGVKPWERIARGAMLLLQEHNVEMCYWAAGEWWGAYPMSIQPPSEDSLGSALFRSLKKN